MISRPFAATLLAASFAVVAGGVHAQYGPAPAPSAPAVPPPRPAAAAPAAPAASALSAPTASAPAINIPPHKCVKPDYPGKLASNQKFNAFNKDFNTYGECMKKYIDEIKVTLNAATLAVNGAVEEFNKFAADIKAQDEAAKN